MDWTDITVVLVKLLGRFVCLTWGLVMFYPSLKVATPATDHAVTSAFVLMTASLFFVLAGVLAKWSLFGAACFAMVMTTALSRLPCHLLLLWTVVPVVMGVALLHAMEWIDDSDVTFWAERILK